ncbi:MAG: transcription antitermination factor NusB [Trueperaceae bacterium]
MARRRAREVAFQALFQADRGATPVLDAWLELRAELAEEPEDEPYADVLGREDVEFAERLVRAFEARKVEIDLELSELIQGWTFGQMAQTDLNVLRLALAEMALAETPAVVAVEMAVRLAKRFGGEDSGRFVNGVLAKALRRTAPVAEDVA